MSRYDITEYADSTELIQVMFLLVCLVVAVSSLVSYVRSC